jgi:RimJ/RimL family protein N-acetyltransferase
MQPAVAAVTPPAEHAARRPVEAADAADAGVRWDNRMGIEGTLVSLRASRESDRRAVFEWLVESDVTPSMMGPPVFPEVQPPTWDRFCDDYDSRFFDGSSPETVGSFVIEAAGQAVGQVNYEVTDPLRGHVELDIWLRSESDCGHGYGPDALSTLTRHLRDSIRATEFIIRPSRRNPRAIRAYQKAGFALVAMSTHEQTRRYGAGDYRDTVVLRMRVPAEQARQPDAPDVR